MWRFLLASEVKFENAENILKQLAVNVLSPSAPVKYN